MKNAIKKSLSIFLSLCMLLSVTVGLDLSAIAADGDVKSISYTPANTEPLIENYNGYECEGDNDPDNDEVEIYYYYYYGKYYSADGDILTVNYKDGTSKSYVFNYDNYCYVSSDGEVLNSDYLSCSDDQYSNHWTVGSDNYFTVSYMGAECKVPVTIIENTVKSISYTPANTEPLLENYNGYEDTDSNGDSYYYYRSQYWKETGDVLTVNYKDATSKTYTYQYNDDKEKDCFTSSDGDVLNYDYLNYDDNQYENHWTVGSDNYFTVSYIGVKCKVPVTIIENPVKSISYTPANTDPLIENCGGDEETDRNDDSYYYYYYSQYWKENGDVLTVNYKDGTSKTYTFQYYEDEDGFYNYFASSDGEVLNDDYLDYDNNQYENHWTLGSDNYFTVSYAGVECKVPVTIIETPVESISYTRANNDPLIENCGGEKAVDKNGDTYYYYYYPLESGDVLTVNYKDGTSKNYICNTYGLKFDFKASDGEVLNSSYLDYGAYQYENHWTVGSDNYFTVSYTNVECKVPVTIIETPVESISYTPVNTNLLVENSGGYKGIDENDDTFYYYYQENYCNKTGDVLTVNYKDGTSKKYICKYNEDEEKTYFTTSDGEILNNDYLDYDNDQYENHWTVGSDNYFTVSCMGVECKVPVTIIESNHVHTYNKGTVTKVATCVEEGTMTYTCTVCGATKAETIPITSHSYETKKATLSKNGAVKCSVCGDVKSTIYSPKTIKLSATSYTYDGKAKKPSVTVKDSKGNTISSKYYTVSYAKGRKNVGKYSVKVTFKGNYSDSKTLYFTINPKGTSVSKLTAGKKAFTVKWSKQKTQTTGYQIQYSTSSKFKNAKTVTVSKNSTTSQTIKKLKAKKKYYVRIRTYKTVGKAKYYSSWSKAKTVKTK